MRMLFKTMRMVGMTVALVGSALVSSAEPIRGTSNNPGVPGVFGEHTNGVGGAAAIIGQSEGRGVLGISNIGQGVWGASESSTGVVGVSKTGFGTSGESGSGPGVFGRSNSTNSAGGEFQNSAGGDLIRAGVAGGLFVSSITAMCLSAA